MRFDEKPSDFGKINIKGLLFAALLFGLCFLSFPAAVAAKGAWMDLGPPELPPGYVWVNKIWLNDAVDAPPE